MSNDEKDVVVEKWVTKYALSNTGVVKATGTLHYNPQSRDTYFSPDGFYQWMSASKKEYHDTLEEALAHTEVMRAERIASLKKSIARLEKMKVKVKK